MRDRHGDAAVAMPGIDDTESSRFGSIRFRIARRGAQRCGATRRLADADARHDQARRGTLHTETDCGFGFGSRAGQRRAGADAEQRGGAEARGAEGGEGGR